MDETTPDNGAAEAVGFVAKLTEVFLGEHANAEMYRLIGLLGIALLLALIWSLLIKKGGNPFQTRELGFLRRFAGRAIMLGLVAVVFFWQINIMIQERRFKLKEDTLYLPSADTVSIVAVGFNEVLSDILFLRAIQAYGGGWQFTGSGGRPALFEHYFNVITDLDPTFDRAYTFGNLLIGEEMRAPGPAMGLLEKGKFLNPESYRVAYEGGFFAVDRLDDYERGAHYMRWALQSRDAPDWVERQIDYFTIREGKFEIGYRNFLRLYLAATDDGNWIEQNISRNRLKETMKDWSKDIISKALERYREANGEYPPKDSLRALLPEFIEDYTIYDSRLLFPPEEFPEPIRQRFEAISPLNNDQIMALPLEERLDAILEQISMPSAQLSAGRGQTGNAVPPAYKTETWFYYPQPDRDSFHLEPMTEGNAMAQRAQTAYGQVLALERSQTAMVPPSLVNILEGLNYEDPESALLPDPRGTFLLYDPETGSLDYMSFHWDEMSDAEE